MYTYIHMYTYTYVCIHIYMHTFVWLIHVDAWQKPMQYCKAIILQLKTNLKKKKMHACIYTSTNAEKDQVSSAKERDAKKMFPLQEKNVIMC